MDFVNLNQELLGLEEGKFEDDLPNSSRPSSTRRPSLEGNLHGKPDRQRSRFTPALWGVAGILDAPPTFQLRDTSPAAAKSTVEEVQSHAEKANVLNLSFESRPKLSTPPKDHSKSSMHEDYTFALSKVLARHEAKRRVPKKLEFCQPRQTSRQMHVREFPEYQQQPPNKDKHATRMSSQNLILDGWLD